MYNINNTFKIFFVGWGIIEIQLNYVILLWKHVNRYNEDVFPLPTVITSETGNSQTSFWMGNIFAYKNLRSDNGDD